MNVIVNPHVLVEPKLKIPITSDMADIVDAFRRNGLIRRKPGAVYIGNQLHVHPVVMAEMRRIQDKQKELSARLYGRQSPL